MKMAISMCAQFKPESNHLSSIIQLLRKYWVLRLQNWVSGKGEISWKLATFWSDWFSDKLWSRLKSQLNPFFPPFFPSSCTEQRMKFRINPWSKKKKQPRIYIIHNYVCFPSIPTLWPPQSRGFWNGYIDWNDDDEMTEWFHFALIASSVRLIYLKSQHCQYFSFELLLKHALPYPHFVVVFRNVCKVCLLLNYLGLHGLKVRIFITVE